MTKVYVLIYDTDNGSREDCNIFYSPIEVFTDPETRAKRIEFIENNTDYDIGFRTEDLDMLTDHLFDIPENLLPYDNDNDDNNSVDDQDDHSGEDLKPVKPFAEYIFAAGLADDAWDDTEQVTTVYVVKQDYYTANHKLADESLSIRMPWGFGEIDNSRYEYNGTIDVAKQLLIDLGMQEDDKFTDFCRVLGLNC